MEDLDFNCDENLYQDLLVKLPLKSHLVRLKKEILRLNAIMDSHLKGEGRASPLQVREAVRRIYDLDFLANKARVRLQKHKAACTRSSLTVIPVSESSMNRSKN